MFTSHLKHDKLIFVNQLSRSIPMFFNQRLVRVDLPGEGSVDVTGVLGGLTCCPRVQIVGLWPSSESPRIG